MTSDVMTASNNRVYISIPKKYIKGLSLALKLDHGLLITGLNPTINEKYVQTYFKNLGFHSRCKISKFDSISVAFVQFSTEDEADEAYWASPHYIGGTEVVSRRVVSPTVEDESEDEIESSSSKCPPLHSVGLGYTLKDSQRLEEDKYNQDAV